MTAWLRTPLFLLGALAASAVVVALAGRDPGAALGALATGAFGSAYGWANVFSKSIPLLLTGLAVLIAFRAGFWNIGAEGQFVVGAIVAGWLGTRATALGFVHVPVILLVAFAAGAAWCGLAVWLRLRRGALEVISTILLNFVALYLLSWLVHGPLQESARTQPVSDRIAASAELPRLLGEAYPLHAGLLLALAAVALVAAWLARTERGFHLRMVGGNPRAAAWAGVDTRRVLALAGVLSGGLAGVAGAVEVMGVLGRLFDKVSPGYGFTAIAVALLARLRPLWLVPSALFFGALEAGASQMQREADVSWVLVLVIQAVVILAGVGSTVIATRRRSA